MSKTVSKSPRQSRGATLSVGVWMCAVCREKHHQLCNSTGLDNGITCDTTDAVPAEIHNIDVTLLSPRLEALNEPVLCLVHIYASCPSWVARQVPALFTARKFKSVQTLRTRPSATKNQVQSRWPCVSQSFRRQKHVVGDSAVPLLARCTTLCISVPELGRQDFCNGETPASTKT